MVEGLGEWRRVRVAFDGYEGWVHVGYLCETSDSDAEAWRGRATAWSDGAVLVCLDGIEVQLPLRARVMLDGEVVGLPDGRRGRIGAGTVRGWSDAVAAARGTAPERWALACFAGAPYQWGGVTPWGVDCSGLVQTTFAARGVALPRDSSQQVACGVPVALEEIRPGDLLFFRGETHDRITHVAFAGEGDTLIHSTVACGGVLMEPWLPGTRAASLRERLVAVRRLEER